MAKTKNKKATAKAGAKPAAKAKAVKEAVSKPVDAPEVAVGESKPTREGLEAARADCGHGTPEGNRAVAKQALGEINVLAAEVAAEGAASLPRESGAPVGESPAAAAVAASAVEAEAPCPCGLKAEPAASEIAESVEAASSIKTVTTVAGAEPVADESAETAVVDGQAEATGYAAEASTADSATGPGCAEADVGEASVAGAVVAEPVADNALVETSVDAATTPVEAVVETAAAAEPVAATADEPAGHVCQCKTLRDAPPLLQDNPYLPETATIIEVVDETPDVKTFRVVVDDPEKMKRFRFEPGQVGQLSVFGGGESTFVINSPPTRMEYLQFSVMRVGELTTRLHTLKAGDQVGVRAPLGNWFPYESMKGKDIVFIGGGIGLAPLRTLLLFMLDNRQDYGKITLVYGARTPALLCYKQELEEWAKRGDIDVLLTVDQAAPGWDGKVGVVPNLLLEANPSPESIAVTCGPPIMIKFTIQALEKLKFPPENIITTLERRMKCGIGICGRCNIGGKFVCVDGPVFSYAELKELPNEL